MTSLFIDESKGQGYRLAVALVDDSDVHDLRAKVARLRLPRQRRIHFTKESDQRRRQILTELERLGVRSRIFLVTGQRQLASREWCLTGVADMCAAEGVSRIVIETDDSLIPMDRRVLFTQLRERGLRNQVSYSHQRAEADPLLWIPDAVAWAHAKGGEWSRRVSPIVESVVQRSL